VLVPRNEYYPIELSEYLQIVNADTLSLLRVYTKILKMQIQAVKDATLSYSRGSFSTRNLERHKQNAGWANPDKTRRDALNDKSRKYLVYSSYAGGQEFEHISLRDRHTL
jgi:hypothetical protein